MQRSSNFFNTIWQDIFLESKSNSPFLATLLLVIFIPFPVVFVNSIVVFFLIIMLLKFKTHKISVSFALFVPVLLFVLMALSYFWSIDKAATLKALPKELILFILPLAFMLLPTFSLIQKNKIIHCFSYSMLLFVLVFLARAVIRYFMCQNIDVFFYHNESPSDFGLVPKLLNAIHVAAFVAIAFFYFLNLEKKTIYQTISTIILFGFIVLLSSKNVLMILFLLIAVHFFFFSKMANKMRLRNSIVFLLFLSSFFFYNNIKEKIAFEFQLNTENNIGHNVIPKEKVGPNIISINEAWNNVSFTPNDYFSGVAFRTYQARLFFDFLKEENIFWKGFGLNASYKKIEEKGTQYNVFLGNETTEGYQKKNFHNQYIQVFAELGIVGFVLLILILFLNTKNAFKNKDFLHIAFAILMLSLFLTESFLWRQRGVVFFTVFYCLFNTTRLNNKE
jgi:hypothetical protein